MKEIELTNLKLYQLRNAEHYQLHVPVLECITNQAANVPGLAPSRTKYQKAVGKEDELFKRYLKSPETELLHEIDHQRDDCLEEVKRTVRFELGGRDVSKKEAAKRVKFVLDNFKGAEQKPYAENTALVTNLLQDLDKTENQEAVALLGLTEVVEELRGHNIAFDATYGKRAKEQELQREEGRLFDTRGEVDTAFFEVAKVINVLYMSNELTGKDPVLAATLGGVIDEINGRIAQTKRIYARRSGNKSKPSSKPGGNGNGGDEDDSTLPQLQMTDQQVIGESAIVSGCGTQTSARAVDPAAFTAALYPAASGGVVRMQNEAQAWDSFPIAYFLTDEASGEAVGLVLDLPSPDMAFIKPLDLIGQQGGEVLVGGELIATLEGLGYPNYIRQG
jgi:hypothetical protein